jgi:anti-sigma-K factor RskA
MNAHEQFADDLALYALGALPGEERSTLEAHLKSCPECRAELERLRGDAALLAFSTSGPRPPARSRSRLLAAIAAEAPPATARVPGRGKDEPRSSWRFWFAGLGWAAAAAAVVFSVMLSRRNDDLQQRVAGLESNSSGQQQQLQQAKELISTLTAPDAARYVLVAGKTPPKPEGRAIYVASNSTLVFLASNMPELPPQKIYELWLIPTTGAPIPAGLFRPDAHGSAAIVKPTLPPGVEAKTFAITVEPEAGSPAPTSQPIMVGTRG